MIAPPDRHLAVTGTFNIRDLGGYAHSDGTTAWRRILRADGLHRLDAAGVGTLKRLGVTTVIDLRRADELEQQPNPFRAEEGVTYRNISLFDELAPSGMSGDDVLLDLYLRALSERGVVIVEVLTEIANASDGVVLFHCTAGKDRTGIIAAMLLSLAGVADDLIVEDYALTKERIAPRIADFIADAQARGVDVDAFRPLLACEASTMVATLSHLSGHHGSVVAYLESIGLDPAAAARLRARLQEHV
jgi:protein-tyrosine phosphatase